MMVSLWILAAAPAGILLLFGLIPTAWADRHPRALRRSAAALTTALLVPVLAACVLAALHGPVDVSFPLFGEEIPVRWGIHIDGLAAVMSALIACVGWVVTRYSVRYLDGDPTQGRFLRWIGFTLGSVLLLVVSGNLLMFTLAWVLTSFGLHHLLTHYGNRPAALAAARKKFLISRLGDAFLVAGLVLTYQVFGTFEFGEIFAAAAEIGAGGGEDPGLAGLIGLCFVLGAMTKSAQFPFHSWLPDTMETPTPVSALMHAGIINAGGFLVLRLAPLVLLSPFALSFLAVVGTLTALFGAVVMLTQTSVKRALAYSTIAQMGFMMLQCGLGAFAAALLHIVGHSLYKAHAFLRSGSVVEEANRLRGGRIEGRPGTWKLASLLLASLSAVALCLGAAWAFGITREGKPGALVLGALLTIAVASLLWNALRTRRLRTALIGFAAAAGVAFGYFALVTGLEPLLGAAAGHRLLPSAVLEAVLLVLIVGCFVGIFLLQAGLAEWGRRPALAALQVHAANGFYLDLPLRRLVHRIWGRSLPAR